MELAGFWLGCTLTLAAALACSSGEPEMPPKQPVESAGAIDRVDKNESIELVPTIVPESGPGTSPGPEADDRIGEILDIEPTGDGLDELIRVASESSDPHAREAAVVALGDTDDPRALDALIAATEDVDPNVVLAALDQLRWSDDRLAEDAILRLVDSPNPGIAAAAREGLGE